MRKPRRALPGPATEQFCVEARPDRICVPATLHGLRTVDKVFWNPPAEVRAMPLGQISPDFAKRFHQPFLPKLRTRSRAGGAPSRFVPNG
jgi:hypothetical protein